MPVPSYGAAPLAKTFLIVRILQLIAFIAIVGITANFTAQIVSTGVEVPKEVVGTLTVTCLAAFYCLVSLPFFWAEAHIGLYAMSVIDFFMLIAFIVIAVTLGKPLSYLNCPIIGDVSSATDASYAWAFTQSIHSNLNKDGSWVGWSGLTRTNCYESKAIWGMSIGLCVLFAFSTLLLPALFAKKKRADRSPVKSAV